MKLIWPIIGNNCNYLQIAMAIQNHCSFTAGSALVGAGAGDF